MTREEAKREMLFAKREVMADSYIDKAYDMAIKALEQPEIVYCKDCAYSRSDVWLYANGSATVDCYCTRTNFKISPNDFCSKPERREEGDLK